MRPRPAPHPEDLPVSTASLPEPFRPSRLERAEARILALLILCATLVHSSVLSDPFGLPKRLLIIATALTLLLLTLVGRLIEEGSPGRRSAATWAALAYALISALAIIPAANPALGAWGLADIAAGVALFWIASRCVRGPATAGMLLRAALAGAALVAIGTLAQIAFPGFHPAPFGMPILPPGRGGATVGDAGLAAQVLILAMPLGIGAAALSRGATRSVCGALLGLVVAALLYAGRPEAWLAGAGAAGLLAAGRILQVGLRRGTWRDLLPDPAGGGLRTALIGLIVVLALTAGMRLVGPTGAGERPGPLRGVTLLSPTTGDPGADRAAALPATVALIARHPLGVGPDHFRHAFLEVAWTTVPKSPFSLSHQAVHPGNSFLEVAAESGLAGGIVFGLLVLTLLTQAAVIAVRAGDGWDRLGLAAFGLLGALVLMAFLGAPFQEPVPALLFWVVGGLLQAAPFEAGALPAGLRWLAPTEVRFVPRSLRHRSLLLAGVAAWLALAVSFATLAWDRVEAAWWTLLGQGAYYAGQYQPALRALQQPAVKRTFDHLPHALAASAYLRLGFNAEAVAEFDATLARSPHFLSAFLGRASARESMGLYDLADADLRAALALWPDNPEFIIALGRLEATRGRIDAALARYQGALQLDPGLAEPYYRIGEIFMRRSRYDDAIEAFRVCGMKNPRYPRLQLSLGDAFYQKGMYEMALRHYTGAASLDDKDVEPRLRIANVQHALGHPCDAQEALEAARELETDASKRDAILDLLKKVEPQCRKQGGRPGEAGAARVTPPGGRG